MRIALVYDAIYPWVAGGAERRFWELATRLRERHDVHLVGWQWWDGPATTERDGVTLHGVGRAPALYGDDGKRTVREAVSFSRRVVPALLRGRWDVVDCSATPYVPLYAAWLAARLTRARLVVTWHEFWGPHWSEYLPHRPVVAGVARALEAGGRRLGDRVVAVSDFTAAEMRLRGDPRLEVVPNGVDVATLTDAPPVEEGGDLVFIGRLIDEKRLDLVLDAMHLMRDRFPHLRLAIVGDGPERAALEARAASLDLADRVRFHGRVAPEDGPRHLRAARILVMPSVREGYGMAVAEAQAAGVVPVVVRSRFSAAAALVRDGIDGLVVEPTAAGLAEAIGALLDDPARLSVMAGFARQAGAARDWDAVAERMEALYLGRAAEAVIRDPAPEASRTLEWS